MYFFFFAFDHSLILVLYKLLFMLCLMAQWNVSVCIIPCTATYCMFGTRMSSVHHHMFDQIREKRKKKKVLLCTKCYCSLKLCQYIYLIKVFTFGIHCFQYSRNVLTFFLIEIWRHQGCAPVLVDF